jgi:hypothetical protein
MLSIPCLAADLNQYRERANSDDAKTVEEAFFHANARGLVISHIEPNKLRVGGREFRVKRNPAGPGCFVYDPRTRFYGVKRNLVWWVPKEGSAYPLNSPSKMVTPGLKWPREDGIDAPSTGSVIDYVFEGKPLRDPNAGTPGPELAVVSCATKEGARQIRKTNDIMKLFDSDCWVHHPDKETFAGEEDGLVKVRVTRNGSIRWTVYRHEAAK